LSASASQDWRRALLREDASVQDAIRSLDASGLQIVLIAAADDSLVGTLTDGDIRRGLLRGLNLDSPIATIIHRNPFIVPPQLGDDSVRQLMQANRIRQLPVVDEHQHVVGLHVWDDVASPAHRPNVMVLMAGGQGTRLRPYTENCPKPLLPVAGRPMLEHIIARAQSQGFGRFVVATHFLGHMIEKYFGDGARWGVRIDYVREESALGTAGAIRLLNPRPDAAFVVSNGDVLADIHYGELLDFHLRNRAVATMAVRAYEWQHPFGVVHTRGVDIVAFEEKPISRSRINAGIYVLDPAAIDSLNEHEYCDMPTLFGRLQAAKSRTIVYPMHEPWLDVGRADDLSRAQTLNSDKD
jgi:dTDP-glucose pyrophosphorylase